MTAITKVGRDLAWKLNPWLGTTDEIDRTCSAIVRNAKSVARLTLEQFNGPSEFVKADRARWDRWEHDNISHLESAEQRLDSAVMGLPFTDDGPFTVTTDGDVRGYVVKLVGPTEEITRAISNDWGQDGLGLA